MSDAGLPTDVLDMIARHLDSMEQVQVLLVLRRDAARTWPVDAMAGEVRATREKIAAALATLAANQLVSVETGDPRTYRYSPVTPALEAAVDNLEIAYNTRPVTLVKALYNRPPRAIQSFADAFRLRKPDGGE